MQSLETMEDARAIASRVLAGDIQANMGCTLIAAVSENLGMPGELMAFDLLFHEQYGHEHLGITAESCVPDILTVCSDLLADRPNNSFKPKPLRGSA